VKRLDALPEHSVHVGDSIEDDVQGLPRLAGLTALPGQASVQKLCLGAVCDRALWLPDTKCAVTDRAYSFLT
jgi:hypothetical protein